MSWLSKIGLNRVISNTKKDVPKGVWHKCRNCRITLYLPEFTSNLSVCPSCNFHERIPSRDRLNAFLDKENLTEISTNVKPKDILKFVDIKAYSDRLNQAQKKTGENDALISFLGTLKGEKVVVSSFLFSFLGGSMGSVVGEKFVQAVNCAIENDCPFICFTSSGGARMQESLFSLMQMAKTSAALTKLAEKGLPYIVVLTDPTTGGVSASLAMLGDIHIAEPNALIGFAGPRVIEQTVREKLPEGFQRSEFLQEKGTVDMIIDRRKLRDEIADILKMLMSNRK